MFEEDKKSIFILISEENIELLRSLYLSRDNNPELNTLVDQYNNNATVVHSAVFQDNLVIYNDIMKYLERVLSKEELKSLINKQNSKGVAPIHFASFKGRYEIIKDLISKGADIYIKTERLLNVMHYAAQGNQSNSLVFFKEEYNFTLSEKDNGGSTPLHWAAYAGAESALLYLLSWNVNINERDNEDFTPLHLAVVSKKMKIVKRLLQKGAIVNQGKLKSPSPRELAEKKKFYSIAIVLKNSEKCQLCAFKAPIKKMTKSRFNIYIVFAMQIFTALILLLILYPLLSTINNDCTINNFLSIPYFILTFIFFIFYIYLIFSNSGVIEPPKNFNYRTCLEKNENLADYCPKCKIKFNKRSKHCVICDKCVYNFDHHCYWVNNCIGGNNYCHFILFLIIALIDVAFILGLAVANFVIISKWKVNFSQRCNLPYLIDINSFLKKISESDQVLKIILFSINTVFLLASLLFFIPVLLLCFCHSRNVCHNIKNKPKYNSLQTESLISNSNSMNNVQNTNLSLTNVNDHSK